MPPVLTQESLANPQEPYSEDFSANIGMLAESAAKKVGQGQIRPPRAEEPEALYDVEPGLQEIETRISVEDPEEVKEPKKKSEAYDHIPPTFARNVSPKAAKRIRLTAQDNTSFEPGEREKIIAIAKNMVANPKFSKMMTDRLEKGTLSPLATERLEAATTLLESAREAYPEAEALDPQSLSDFVDHAILASKPLGPDKTVRVHLNRNLRTGKLSINVPKIYNALTHSWAKKLAQDQGIDLKRGDPKVVKGIIQEAKDQAAYEIQAHALRAHNTALTDPQITEADIKKRSKESFHNLKTFVENRAPGDGIWDAMSPTAKSLAEEGPLDYWFRVVSPLEWTAPKLKLMREKREKLGYPPEGPIDVILSAFYALGVPGTGVADRLGITPEDEVRAYTEHVSFLEEAMTAQGLAAKSVAKALGADEKRQQEVYKNATTFIDESGDFKPMSLGAMAMPMAAYMIEPDGFTAALILGAKGTVKGVRHYEAKQITKAANILEEYAKNPDSNLAEALFEMEKVSGVSAAITKIRLSLGRTIAKIDQDASSLTARKEAATEATESLKENLAGAEIDDLKALVNKAVENPDIVDDVLKIVDERIQVLGLAQATNKNIAETIQTLVGEIKAQEAAKINHLSVIKESSDLAVDIQKTLNKSEELREFWEAKNFVGQIKRQLDEALEAKNLDAAVEAKDKLKKAQAEVRKLGKTISPEQKAWDIATRKRIKATAKKAGKNREKFLGDDVLTEMLTQENRLRGLLTQSADELSNAQNNLSRAARRLIAVHPESGKKLRKIIKGLKAPAESQQIIRVAESTVGKFVESERKLARSVLANQWRKNAVEFSKELRDSAEFLRSGMKDRGLIWSKTGVLGARSGEATSIFTRAISESDHVYDPATIKVTEATGKEGRVVNIEYANDDAFKISAEVSNDNPGVLTVTKVDAPEAASKSPTAISNIQALIEYAVRNDLALATAPKAKKLADLLRASGMPMGASNSISASKLKSLDAGDLAAQLQAHSTRILLDGRGLRPKLEAAFGQTAVAHILTRTGEDGKLLARAIEAERPIGITIDEAKRLQIDLAEVLAKAEKVLDPKYKTEKLAAILADANAYTPLNKKGIIKVSADIVRRVLRTFDPWLRQLGTAGKEIQDLVRAGDNILEAGWEEYELVLRQAGRGKNAVAQATYRYLDTTARILLPSSRSSVINVGPLTIFQRAKRSILNDTPRLKYNKSEKVDFASEINNPALLGLSRIWLPFGKAVSEGTASKLYGEAIKNLKKASTAEEFIQLQRNSTTKYVQEGRLPSKGDADAGANLSVDPRSGRVHAFAARSFLVASTYDELSILARKTTGGLLSADEANDVNKVLSGEYSNVKDAEKAFDTIYAMGVSFLENETQVSRKAALGLSEAQTASKQIIQYGTDPSGEATFALNLARTNLEKGLDKYIKSLAAAPPRVRDLDSEILKKLFLKYLAVWRTDAVTGFGIPNVGRVWLDASGDWCQNMFTQNIGFANRVLFQNLPASIPHLGPYLQNRASKAVKGKPPLRSLVETVMNPHIDDFWRARPGALRIGKDGPLVSYDFLRKRAVMDGILDTRASVEVIDLAQKLVNEDPFFKRIKAEGADEAIGFAWWQRGIENWIQTSQQRQRAGTWLLHLNDGRSLDEATRLTREALYDWRHGMSEAELLYSLRSLPFIRWGRLTASQLSRGILDPLTKPALEGLTAAGTGKTAFNRLRVMHRMQREMLPRLTESRSMEEIQQEEGYINAAARALYPHWMKQGLYPMLGIRNYDRGNMEASLQLYGDKLRHTHWASVGTPNGLLDMMNMGLQTSLLPVAAYLAAKGEDAAARDLFYKSAEGLSGMMYPGHRELFESVLGIQHGTGISIGAPVYVNPTKAEMLGKLGAEVGVDARGRHYTSQLSSALLNILPVLSVSGPRAINDWKYRNPGVGDSLAEQMKWFALNQTRLLKQYNYNVFDEHRRLSKRISEAAKISEKKAGLVSDE